MARTASTATATDDKVAALHEQITEGVAALVDSDAWRDMLKMAAKFHHYSLSNLLLVAIQRPDATRVAGFRTWQSLGRQVRKGEKGIAILAPIAYRPKKDESAAADTAAAAGSGDAPTEPGKPAKARARRFKAAHVFDVSQTDGDPLPDAGPALLTGQAPAGLWDALAAQVTAHGYTIERGPCGGANGYTDPAAMVVRVRDAVDEAQAVKTLAHDPLTALPARDRGDLSGWCGYAAPVVLVLVLSWLDVVLWSVRRPYRRRARVWTSTSRRQRER